MTVGALPIFTSKETLPHSRPSHLWPQWGGFASESQNRVMTTSRHGGTYVSMARARH